MLIRSNSPALSPVRPTAATRAGNRSLGQSISRRPGLDHGSARKPVDDEMTAAEETRSAMPKLKRTTTEIETWNSPPLAIHWCQTAVIALLSRGRTAPYRKMPGSRRTWRRPGACRVRRRNHDQSHPAEVVENTYVSLDDSLVTASTAPRAVAETALPGEIFDSLP